MYVRHQGNMLNYLRTFNPKGFYKHFQKRKQNSRSELTTDDFLNNFRNLASSEPKVNHEVDECLSNYATHVASSSFNVLDADTTEKEIYDVIHSLKINKACGYDNVLNEYVITCKDVLMSCLHLFLTMFLNLVISHMHRAGRSSEVERSLMVRWVVGSILHGVDSLSYFSFQPVLHDWCNKGRGMCYPVCGMVHIKEPLLLIGKSSLCGGSGHPFSLSEWSLTTCLTSDNRR